jgi:hypothetical protein
MQKITVVGEDSAAKKAVIVALRSNFKVIDLHQEQIDINNANPGGLAVYVEAIHQQNSRRSNSRPLFLQSHVSKPKLNNVQQRVFLRLANGLSDEANWEFLHLSRSEYFKVLKQLRMLFEVGKNWELVRLARIVDANS